MREGELGKIIGRGAGGLVVGQFLANLETSSLIPDWHERFATYHDPKVIGASLFIFAVNMIGLGILGGNVGALVDIGIHKVKRIIGSRRTPATT